MAFRTRKAFIFSNHIKNVSLGSEIVLNSFKRYCPYLDDFLAECFIIGGVMSQFNRGDSTERNISVMRLDNDLSGRTEVLIRFSYGCSDKIYPHIHLVVED